MSSFILKILTGPQEGAEVELTAGRSATVGSGFQCDIALVDAMLAPEQGTFVVQEAGVQFTATADGVHLGEEPVAAGKTVEVPLYTALTLGGTRVALGKPGETWPPITWPELSALKPAEVVPTTPEEEPSAEPAEGVPAPAAEEPPAPTEKSARGRATRYLVWALLALVVLLLALGVGCVFWRFSAPPRDIAKVLKAQRREQLEKLMETHGLTLKDGVLAGNLKEARTRLDIERFVYTEFPGEIQPELTDDQTLRESLSQVLEGLGSGLIVVDGVTDCRATVHGLVPTKEVWANDLEHIRQDVPKLKEVRAKFVVCVDETLIRMRNVLRLFPAFGNVAVSWKNNQFVFEGVVEEGSRKDFLEMLTEVGKNLPRNAVLVNAVKWRVASPSAAVAGTPGAAPDVDGLPITGVIFQPFTCLQLKDGTRVFEGGAIGDFLVEKITPDEVIFRQGGRKVTWRP
jgi:type III secretion system YscD/HrpQ family protein